MTTKFTYKDVLEKVNGLTTKCYISGIDIDLTKDEFHFDHIIPISKGGNNSLENLGITLPIYNQMKTDLLLEDFFKHCIIVLENNGYTVTKINV